MPPGFCPSPNIFFNGNSYQSINSAYACCPCPPFFKSDGRMRQQQAGMAISKPSANKTTFKWPDYKGNDTAYK